MFLSELTIRELSDGKKQLTLPLIYACDTTTHIVPVGFITDYASVPRSPMLYFLFNGVANRAATLHDFLYSSRGESRHASDNTFLLAMLEEKVPKWKAYAMYYAVRLFGKGVREKAYGFINE